MHTHYILQKLLHKTELTSQEEIMMSYLDYHGGEHKRWTEQEKAKFNSALLLHGKDFSSIARVVGTKSLAKTKNYG